MEMKHRLLAFCLAMAFLLPAISASNHCYAADSYLITVAEDTVLQNAEDNGMAVYIDGIIYTPYDVVRSIKGVYATYNQNQELIVVYQVGTILYFELDSGLTYDSGKNSIPVSAKVRGGVPYVPIQIISAWFGLYFTFTPASSAGLSYPIVRLASTTPAVSDSTLFQRNATALSAVAAARDKNSGIITGDGSSTTPGTTTPSNPDIKSRETRLMFTGVPDDRLTNLLDALNSYELSGAFFLPADRLLDCQDALRQIYASGFSVGITVSGQGDPAAEAQQAALTLGSLLQVRVRLVCAAQPLTPKQIQSLEDAGFCYWQATLTPDTGKLSSAQLLSAARKALRKAEDQSILSLPADGMSGQAMSVLCSYLVAQNFTVSPITDWSISPF